MSDIGEVVTAAALDEAGCESASEPDVVPARRAARYLVGIAIALTSAVIVISLLGDPTSRFGRALSSDVAWAGAISFWAIAALFAYGHLKQGR